MVERHGFVAGRVHQVEVRRGSSVNVADDELRVYIVVAVPVLYVPSVDQRERPVGQQVERADFHLRKPVRGHRLEGKLEVPLHLAETYKFDVASGHDVDDPPLLFLHSELHRYAPREESADGAEPVTGERRPPYVAGVEGEKHGKPQVVLARPYEGSEVLIYDLLHRRRL